MSRGISNTALSEEDFNPENHSRNMAQANRLMMQKAYNSFGGHGKTSPPRLTQTQTFSKEEKNAVHLLYDPNFKDENDFRPNFKKAAMSPGPGAHKDPLKSYKYVIPTNGKYSIPKVSNNCRDRDLPSQFHDKFLSQLSILTLVYCL